MRPGSYEEWIARYDTISGADRETLAAEEQRLPLRPLFSILLPVYNPQFEWLRAAIDSVKAQTYSRWELCLADDASTAPGVRAFLKEQAQSDSRIRLVFRATNGHISACSNSALALARGDWCGLLDQDDLLAPHALSLVAREVNANLAAGLIYSDEDFIDTKGARSSPFIKPDWNPELFLGQNYINHFGVYRTELLREIGGFREGFEGSQDYDLALRCIEQLPRGQICHIPRVLYHWRMVPGSLAEVRDAKPYAKDAARRALTEHMQRREIAARVEPCPENVESHRVTYLEPLPAYEVIEHDGDSAAINRAAERARAPLLIFIERGVEVDSLDDLLRQANRANVGAVGARVWSSDGTLRNGGLILGLAGVAAEAHAGLPRGHPGFFNRTFLQRNCAAVSLACFTVRRDVFEMLGGFDVANLKHRYHDIDFCLRAAEHGLRTVWTPYVNPVFRGLTRTKADMSDDDAYMRKRWGEKLPNDSFYSPCLSLASPGFELAFPPRWSARHTILSR